MSHKDRLEPDNSLNVRLFEDGHSPMAIIKKTQEGTIVIADINKAMAELIQRSRDEVADTLPGEAIGCIHSMHPEGCGGTDTCNDCDTRTTLKETFETGESILRREVRHIDHDKDERFFCISSTRLDINGEVAVVLSLENITAQKQADKETLASRKAIETLLESVVGKRGQELFDQLTKKLQEWINVDCVIVGQISDDKESVTVLSMYLNGDYNREYTSYKLEGTPCADAAEKGYCVYSSGIQERFPDDDDLVKMNAQGYVGIPMRNKMGETVGILCCVSQGELKIPHDTKAVMRILAADAGAEISRQINDRKREELEKQLHHSRRLETLGQLAAEVSHAGNNLLATIMGYAEMARNTLRNPHSSFSEVISEGGEALDIIIDTAQQNAELNKQLLTFGRQEEVESERINVNTALTEITKPNTLLGIINKRVKVTTHLSPDNCLIIIGKNQLNQVILNLVINAAHSMPDGGDVIIRTSKKEIDSSNIGVHLEATEGKYIKITVSDTGTGIDRDDLPHIYDPFFTTKEKGKGTGLGLSTVYGIVKQYGGFIEVTSEKGKGTTFEIYIPEYIV